MNEPIALADFRKLPRSERATLLSAYTKAGWNTSRIAAFWNVGERTIRKWKEPSAAKRSSRGWIIPAQASVPQLVRSFAEQTLLRLSDEAATPTQMAVALPRIARAIAIIEQMDELEEELVPETIEEMRAHLLKAIEGLKRGE